MILKYIRLEPNIKPPDISKFSPFKSVVIIEELVTLEWQTIISDWLVNSGCLYMMAWGNECSSWDDSVDVSLLEKWDYNDIPEDSFIMTTWHENEPLEEVFWFSKHCAYDSNVDIKNTLLIHISKLNKEDIFLAKYKQV